MASGLLWRAHMRGRGRRNAALLAAFAVGQLAVLVLASVVQDAQDGLVAPLAATTTGDLRVTQDSRELAGGVAWTDVRPVVSELRDRSGGSVSARLEVGQIVVDEGDPDAWTGGILYGIDTADPSEQRALERLLVWGSLPSREAYAPDGTSRVPVVVGEEAARRLGIERPPGGQADFERALRITSGRFAGAGTLPLHEDAVVVGVFRSGVSPIDRFTAYAPIESARQLSGHGPIDPVANAIVLRGGDIASARAWAMDEGYTPTDPATFGRSYLGAVLVALEVTGLATAAALLVVLASWLVQETVAAVADDRPLLATLAGIGIPRRMLVTSYAAVGATVVATASLIAATVAWAMRHLPTRAVAAPGLDVQITWHVPPWAWWIPVATTAAAVLVGLLAAATAQRRILTALHA